MKKKLILSLIVGSIFMSGCSCSLKKKPNDNNDNGDNENNIVFTDENLVGEQNVNGILLENTTFEVNNGVTTIITKVTNKTEAEFQLDNYQIIITDKNGVILTILTSSVNEKLAVDDTRSYTTVFEFDLSDAANVEYEVNVVVPES